MIYGYARVSTREQASSGNSLEAQEKALKDYGAEVVVLDKFSGRSIERPNFQKLLLELKPGDTLVVTKIDRFARSISQASDLITDLIDRGITVNVLNLGVLSNDSVSTLMRNVLLAFAQFERDMILERTQEGRAIARSKPGYREGRPEKYTPQQIKHALELLETNSYRQVAEMTGISKATLGRYKTKYGNK